MLEIQPGVNEEALQEWIQYREEKKKPLSRLALKKTQNLLAKLDHDHQQETIDISIMNDWQGLFPKPKRQDSTRAIPIHQELTDTSWAH